MPSQTDADSREQEPILDSGDPIHAGGHDDGHSRPQTGATRRSLPLVFLSRGAQVYVGGDPFTDQTTIGDLAGREEVKAAERRASQQHQPAPDAFVFFNAPKTEVKVLLWTDRGYTVLHQRLGRGTFSFSRNSERETASRWRSCPRCCAARRARTPRGRGAPDTSRRRKGGTEGSRR